MKWFFRCSAAFLVGVLLASGVFTVALNLTRPQSRPLNPASLRVDIFKINGKDFVSITGTPINALGAQQYVAYTVGRDNIAIRFFVTRVAFPNDVPAQSEAPSFQNLWPLIIPSSKFRSERVRLTCRSGVGEELVATVVTEGDTLKIDRAQPE